MKKNDTDNNDPNNIDSSDTPSTNSSKPKLTPVDRRKFLKLSGTVGVGAFIGLHNPDGSQLHAATTAFAPAQIPSPTSHKNAIIIGSGFGGGITAYRLAKAGIEATILEKGRRWPVKPEGNTFSPYLYPDGRSTWLSNTTRVPLGPPLPIRKYTGVLQGRDMGGLRIMSAACYGGGSITYGSLHVKPPEHIFDSLYPSELRYSDILPYYDRVGEILGISTMPDDIYQTETNLHYRVMEAHNARAGLETDREIYTATNWDIVRDEINGKIKPSVIRGEAIYGVNSGAKNTLDMNYLKMAEDSGFLEVKTLQRVKNISKASDGKFLVAVEEINERGRVLNTLTYSCNSLFLCAGSMGTSELLVKAKALGHLSELNNETGKGWGNNGNVYALRSGLERTGKWQGGPPSTAVIDYNNEISPLYIEHPQLPLGIESRSLLYFGIGINPTRGHFYYNYFKKKVELHWPSIFNKQSTVNKAILHTMKKLNDANGGHLSPLLGGFKGFKDDSVYHPLGGAVMGKACDFFGRVKNYKGLYVNDSALIPGTTACANPAFTIAAIAERNIERIIEQDF